MKQSYETFTIPELQRMESRLSSFRVAILDRAYQIALVSGGTGGQRINEAIENIARDTNELLKILGVDNAEKTVD